MKNSLLLLPLLVLTNAWAQNPPSKVTAPPINQVILKSEDILAVKDAQIQLLKSSNDLHQLKSQIPDLEKKVQVQTEQLSNVVAEIERKLGCTLLQKGQTDLVCIKQNAPPTVETKPTAPK